LLGTESIGEVLSGVLDSLPSLAEELGKDVPVVRIRDNNHRLRSQASGTLKNVFMHLLRNSVDHGIETADVRTAHGKTSGGTIEIEVSVDADALQITLSDDGRGLALGRIRSIAVERGWIGDDETPSDEAIADLIFRPGFSTAEKVTEVSGRGVGMDAVRDFLKRENGSIELRFTDSRTGADFRQFQTVVSLPDSFVVSSVGTRTRRETDEVPA
jgi:two-component system chemotaxis sensor kinase CheA